jgi:hypothetical protein
VAGAEAQMRQTDSEEGQPRAARYVRNQQLARNVNELIADRRYSSAFGEYVCECGQKTCVAPVSLSFEEFDRLRKQAGRFVVLPGHWSPQHERVVHTEARFQVVEKIGLAAEMAERLTMSSRPARSEEASRPL